MSEKCTGSCTGKTEVWNRVCGFFRPVSEWNKGKKAEFRDRKNFKVGEHEHSDR